MLRFVVGLLAVYVAMVVLERQRMELLFKGVLGELRSFHQQLKAQAGGGPAGAVDNAPASQEQAEDAARILIAALASDDASVRKTAAENLQRLTGEKHGEDAAAWSAWLAGRGNRGG